MNPAAASMKKSILNVKSCLLTFSSRCGDIGEINAMRKTSPSRTNHAMRIFARCKQDKTKTWDFHRK